MGSKRESYDIAVIINIDGKTHQVILSKQENDTLLATIQLMHGGYIKVLDEVVSGILLVNTLKDKKQYEPRRKSPATKTKQKTIKK